MKKLKTFDSSCFIGKNHFEEDGTQNYLVFQPMNKCLKTINTGNISGWRSIGLFDEIIKSPDTSLAPTPAFKGDGKMYLIFKWGCLKQDKVTFNYGKIVNIYIAYDLQSNLNYNPDFTFENCLFGAVTVTKNVDVNKYKYSGYGTGFDGNAVFTHPAGSFGNNAIIFGVDMTSSVHIDNKKRYFNFGKASNTRIRTAFINCRKNVFNHFSATGKRICSSLH